MRGADIDAVAGMEAHPLLGNAAQRVIHHLDRNAMNFRLSSSESPASDCNA